MLEPVVIDKTDTCLTYALKRAGVKTSLKKAHDLVKSVHLVPIQDPFVALYLGAVVVWETPNDYSFLDTGISMLHGKPVLIKNPVFTKYHFGVIEHIEKGVTPWLVTVSDCVRNRNNNSVPEIRLRYINLREDSSRDSEARFPDYLLHTIKLTKL